MSNISASDKFQRECNGIKANQLKHEHTKTTLSQFNILDLTNRPERSANETLA